MAEGASVANKTYDLDIERRVPQEVFQLQGKFRGIDDHMCPCELTQRFHEDQVPLLNAPQAGAPTRRQQKRQVREPFQHRSAVERSRQALSIGAVRGPEDSLRVSDVERDAAAYHRLTDGRPERACLDKPATGAPIAIDVAEVGGFEFPNATDSRGAFKSMARSVEPEWLAARMYTTFRSSLRAMKAQACGLPPGVWEASGCCVSDAAAPSAQHAPTAMLWARVKGVPRVGFKGCTTARTRKLSCSVLSTFLRSRCQAAERRPTPCACWSLSLVRVTESGSACCAKG